MLLTSNDPTAALKVKHMHMSLQVWSSNAELANGAKQDPLYRRSCTERTCHTRCSWNPVHRL